MSPHDGRQLTSTVVDIIRLDYAARNLRRDSCPEVLLAVFCHVLYCGTGNNHMIWNGSGFRHSTAFILLWHALAHFVGVGGAGAGFELLWNYQVVHTGVCDSAACLAWC